MSEKEMIIKIARLEDEIKHLRRCKEFESNLQIEVIEIGMPFMDNIITGKTYDVSQAWNAIKRKLRDD